MLHARTPADLLDKVNKAEGWTRGSDEVRARRVKAAGWVLDRDNRNNRYTASKS